LAQENEHRKEVENLSSQHTEAIDKLKYDYDAAIKALTEKHASEVQEKVKIAIDQALEEAKNKAVEEFTSS